MVQDVLKQVLFLYHQQQHDFMNHLQVINGYLQLGDFGEAQKYSHLATESVHGKKQFAEIPLPFLQSLWLCFSSQFMEQMFPFVFSLSGDWQRWQGLDQDLTNYLERLLVTAQKGWSAQTLHGKFGFAPNNLDLSLVFTGDAASLAALQKEVPMSAKLLVDYEKIGLNQLLIIIKPKKM